MRLAKKIGPDILEFGVYLGVEVATIKSKKAEPISATECSFDILNIWKQRTGRSESVKTYTELIQALTDLERQDLVELVRSGE